jgi:exodeoxyribonuclease V alpha subunit
VDAIKLANDHPIAVITGGAGTGKTTVLKAIFSVCRAAGLEIFAMALSGRAARRIGEATGHSATTIAGFLARFEPNDAPDRAVVVIDEASMLDLLAAYRLFRHLPPQYRFLLVGDPNQLPPVGPGLLLHELAVQPDVPRAELKQVKRYGGMVAQAANAIKNGVWPELPDDPTSDIAFIPCESSAINATVLALLDDDPGSTQILCPTRTTAAGGVNALNQLCVAALHSANPELKIWNHQHDAIQGTGFRVGSPVICLKNDWELNLQNGSLGVILSVEPPSRESEPGQRLGVIRWDDGMERDLTLELLPHLDLAYAITIHKAQGSQFPRIIVPVRPSRLLDRTLIYTAITRAQRQVILIGDMAAAKAAVEAPPHASLRHVALGAMIREASA